MKILFVRHGETTDNLKGSKSPVLSKADLTSQGIEQAHELSRVLQHYKTEKIYSSPMLRTKHTAEFIQIDTSIPFEVLTDLHERNWGDWGDKAWEEVLEIIKEYSIDKRYTFVPPNGESWQQMEKRLLSTLEKIRKEHKENVAILTHVGCLRALIPALKKIEKSHHHKFSVEPGTLTVFCTEKEEFDFIGYRPSEL